MSFSGDVAGLDLVTKQASDPIMQPEANRSGKSVETHPGNEHRIGSSGLSPGNRSGDRSIALRIASKSPALL